MKKTIFKSAGILMLAGAFAISGCSGSSGDTKQQAKNPDQDANFNKTGLPIVNDAVSLKMVSPKAALAPEYSKMEIFNRLEKQTNVKIEWNNIPDTDFNERKICCWPAVICRMHFMEPGSRITSLSITVKMGLSSHWRI